MHLDTNYDVVVESFDGSINTYSFRKQTCFSFMVDLNNLKESIEEINWQGRYSNLHFSRLSPEISDTEEMKWDFCMDILGHGNILSIDYIPIHRNLSCLDGKASNQRLLWEIRLKFIDYLLSNPFLNQYILNLDELIEKRKGEEGDLYSSWKDQKWSYDASAPNTMLFYSLSVCRYLDERANTSLRLFKELVDAGINEDLSFFMSLGFPGVGYIDDDLRRNVLGRTERLTVHRNEHFKFSIKNTNWLALKNFISMRSSGLPFVPQIVLDNKDGFEPFNEVLDIYNCDVLSEVRGRTISEAIDAKGILHFLADGRPVDTYGVKTTVNHIIKLGLSLDIEGTCKSGKTTLKNKKAIAIAIKKDKTLIGVSNTGDFIRGVMERKAEQRERADVLRGNLYIERYGVSLSGVRL